jgi:hypothetical protein
MANLKTFGISSGRLITESVTPAMKYQLCFGSCGCPRIEASSDGVIIAGRWFSGGMFKEVFVSRKMSMSMMRGLAFLVGNSVCGEIQDHLKCAKAMYSLSNTSLVLNIS